MISPVSNGFPDQSCLSPKAWANANHIAKRPRVAYIKRRGGLLLMMIQIPPISVLLFFS